MKKPKIAIISQSIRRDNQKPLGYFDKLTVTHFYHEAPYGELSSEELSATQKFEGGLDLYKKLLQFKPDIIQGTEPSASKKAFVYSLASYVAAKKLKAPLIFVVWDNVPYQGRLNFWQKALFFTWIKYYARLAKKIFYLNSGARRNLLALGIPKNKLIKFLWGVWGVDSKEYRPLSEQEKKFQAEISKVPIILFVGRLEPAKGIKYLLAAFKKVHERFPKTKLVLVGAGYLQKEIEKFRRENGLEKDIILKGIIKNKNLPIYYQSAAIFTSPAVTLKNWEEQVGMTNIQAMACGTPVVSTVSGAIPEYVPNKIAGLLVPERDSDRLASAIIRLLDDKRLHNKISRGGREYARANYNAKKNILQAQELILKILDEQKSLQK